jgi:hypothetical protein
MKGPTPPSVDPRVQLALSSIYCLFAAPTPPVIEGCPCCIGTRGVDALLNTPLRELTGQALWRYATGAFLTIGSERDFRFFLPRILELAFCEPDTSPDVEIVLGKLRLAHWTTWLPHERRAIEELVDLWFDHALARDLFYADQGFVGSDAESVLCAAARAGLDLSPWLARLVAPTAELVRAGIAERHSKHLAAQAPPKNSFWIDAPDGWRSLARAVRSEV